MPTSNQRDSSASANLLATPDKVAKMMRTAHHIAHMVSGWNGRMYVNFEDVYSFIVSTATLSLLRGGNPTLKFIAIDYLRQIGGDSRKLGGPKTRFLQQQLPEDFDMAGDDQYIARLALKRCGVIMLERLHPRFRRVMLLRYWHDLSQNATAIELGVTWARVGQMEREAIKILRVELQRRGIKSLRDVV